MTAGIDFACVVIRVVSVATIKRSLIMADNMADTASRVSEHGRAVEEEGKHVADEMHGSMSDVKTRFKNMAHKCSDQAKHYAQQSYRYAADHSKHAKESTEGFVRDNPWYSLGIAAGVGVLCGLVMRSRGRCRCEEDARLSARG